MVATLAIIVLLIPSTIHSDKGNATQILNPLESLPVNPTATQIKEAIVFTAKNNEVNADTMVALAKCESGFKDICIVDTNNKLSCGIFMFQKATFEGFCPDLQWGDYHVADNILCAGRMIKKGLQAYHWVNCTLKVGNAYTD